MTQCYDYLNPAQGLLNKASLPCMFYNFNLWQLTTNEQLGYKLKIPPPFINFTRQNKANLNTSTLKPFET